jgi:NAD(P)-dependent dehydrogenase (short-subunit alcohol dehydrogenase family)
LGLEGGLDSSSDGSFDGSFDSTAARFAGRVALITGASRGIGYSVAERIIAEGGRVVITARGEDRLREAAERLGSPEVVRYVAGKADDPEHRAATFALIASEFGRLDHFVSNAGINPMFGPILDSDLLAMRKIMELNVIASLGWTKDAVAAGLTTSIVNIASIAGLTSSPGIGFYGVSKAALISLTTQLAYELSPGIRVNAVAPAVIKTDFARVLYEGKEAEVAADYPLKRLGVPADVAGPVAFLLSDDAAWITGQTIVIDGGGSIRPIA